MSSGVDVKLFTVPSFKISFNEIQENYFSAQVEVVSPCFLFGCYKSLAHNRGGNFQGNFLSSFSKRYSTG